MKPTPNKPKELTEREKMIEKLRAQVAQAERRGQSSTAHHQMLKQLLDAPKEQEENGEQNV